MRIRYTGDQATDHGIAWHRYGDAECQGTGLWQPGETKDVPDAVAAALVATGAWTAEDDKPAETPKRRRAASDVTEGG